jgi:hypothetical protein
MPKAPKTYEDLRTDIALTDRVALTVAAVLPNLPEDESLIVLRRTKYGWQTDVDVIADFKKRHAPVAPDSGVYRVRTDTDVAPGNKVDTTPVPHGSRAYHIHARDFVEMVSLDPDEYSFEDTDQSTLTDFGSGSPYFSPYYKIGGEYERKPRLPV